ncbi:CapA family protein [Glycomyces buryatensis]|uniref:CapA family protein n=1 Tax=Glycomyces buryatensis TaxID=2570927 RepID=A0A4S8QDJ0_9ACTN|nr:CapA family protein [Glycomyces buryatensis]THV41152.1 CapA family protein [Glycomyces buryatensis]
MRSPLPSTPSLRRRGLLAASLGSVAAVAACSEEEPTDTGGGGGEEVQTVEESPSPSEPRTITITHVGDTMPGSHPNQLPDDEGASFFDGVKDEFTGDVVIANLEGALSTLEYDKCGGCDAYYFRLPGEYAHIFADAGFHALNQANNHGWDAGPDGAAETQTAIRDAGMEVAGVKGEVAYVEVENGLTVGIVGFAPYDFYTDVRDLEAVAALVAEAKSQADLVVATAHLGAEGSDQQHTPEGSEIYFGEDRGDTRAFTHACVDAGADLVVGHGPHVLRGMEVYNGKLIAYSLGNFGGGQNLFSIDGPLGISGILKVTLDEEGAIQSGQIVPSKMDSDGNPQLDSEGTAIASLNDLAGDFGDAGVTVDDDGALVIPSA